MNPIGEAPDDDDTAAEQQPKGDLTPTHQKPAPDREPDEDSEASFPASDPPANY